MAQVSGFPKILPVRKSEGSNPSVVNKINFFLFPSYIYHCRLLNRAVYMKKKIFLSVKAL